jgi:hypothetical protein
MMEFVSIVQEELRRELDVLKEYWLGNSADGGAVSARLF